MGEARGVARRAQQSRLTVANDLRDGTGLRTNYRDAGGQGLDDHEAEPLVQGGQGKDVGGTKDLRHVASDAQKGDTGAHAQLRGGGLVVAALDSVTDEEKPGGGEFGAHRGKGSQEDVLTLLRRHSPDGGDDRGFGGQP